MPSNPVERKLSGVICPWLVSARQLASVPLYIVCIFYAYTYDVPAGLVGVGLSSPVLKALAGNQGSTDAKLLTGITGPMLYLAVAAGVAWLLLKAVVTREDGEKRSALARSCRREFRQLEARLPQVLQEADPLPALTKMQEEIQTIVDRHIAEGSWVFNGLAPDIKDKVDQMFSQLCAQFGANWTQVPKTEEKAA